jgi:hypothetical protein
VPVEYLVVFGVLGAIAVVAGSLIARHNRKATAASIARNEAMFASMFPDLQPYFHPRNVLEFVRARLAQAPAHGGMRMKNPPGFGVSMGEVSFDTDKKGRDRELWVLRDDAGHELSRFFFESDEKDGIVRVDEGKFRVSRAEDRVRYWRPDREFKWTPPGLWKFVTRVADEPMVSTDRGLSFSDSPSSSPASTAAATAAAVAGIAAAGGTFDGGGASAAWDGRSGSSPDSEGATAGATSY